MATRILAPRPKAKGGEQKERSETTGRQKARKQGVEVVYTQQLAWVNVKNPKELKERATRRKINVHANKEYFRGLKLKSVQRLRESQAPFGAGVVHEVELSTQDGCICTPKEPVRSCNRETCHKCGGSVRNATVSEETQVVIWPIQDDPTTLLGAGRVDPFDSHRMKFTHPSMHVFMECFGANFYENPILNFHEPSSHPLLPYIYQMSLSDPALFYAVQTAGATSMLFRTQRKELGPTAMTSKGNAIRLLNEKLQKPSEAANDAATFITVMMLSALEYHMQNRAGHEAHMRGLIHLLKLRNISQESHLIQWMIKFGLFRIDQSGYVIMGSESFMTPELLPFSVQRPKTPSKLSQEIPAGFRANITLLSEPLIQIIQDIILLQCEFSTHSGSLALPLPALISLSETEASIGYRLSRLPASTPMQNSIRLAVYISSSAMFDLAFGINPLRIFMSVQLGQSLMKTALQKDWNGHKEFLLWILFMGGSFARMTPMNALYVSFLKGIMMQIGETTESWEGTKAILEMFFWSEKGFSKVCEGLWREAKGIGRHPQS